MKILSPCLLNILSDNLNMSNTKLAPFEDDTAIISSSTKENLPRQSTPHHLNLLSPFLEQWKSKLMPQKLTLTQRKKGEREFNPSTSQSDDNQKLDSVEYFGVMLDIKLLFEEQVENIRRTA